MNLENISLEIISNAGEAKSFAFEALDFIEENKYDEAYAAIEEGKQFVIKAEKIHMEVISKEAQGENVKISFLLMHAEDQLMSSQFMLDFAERIVNIFKTKGL